MTLASGNQSFSELVICCISVIVNFSNRKTCRKVILTRQRQTERHRDREKDRQTDQQGTETKKDG